MSGERILIAGIGNVFLADDGFGVEVVRRLGDVELPERVDVVDYGIRGVHLAYDLLGERYGVLVLVDAIPLGEPPGTLGVIEVDLADPGWTISRDDALDAPAADAHDLDPESVLRLLANLGGRVDRIVVVGCQPSVLEERMELSPVIEAVLDDAVALVGELATEEANRLDEPAARLDEPTVRLETVPSGDEVVARA